MIATQSDEMAMRRGLKIGIYPGKWKTAKDLALLTRKDKYPEETAFELACRHFIELGGEQDGGYYEELEGKIISEK